MMRFFIVVFLTICFSLSTQSKLYAETTPQLVVGIWVDGLQADHIRQMEKYFTPGGFRLFLNEGVPIEDVQHPITDTGSAADVATLMAGTYPTMHGVVGNYFFDAKKKKITSILADENFRGIETKQQFSAHNLIASTISDELRLNNSHNQVHVVGIDAETVIMLAGHAATTATWMGKNVNKWVTTNCYNQGLPRQADLMNYNGSYKKIAENIWTPSATISTFINPTLAGSKTVPFSYQPTYANGQLNHSPNANELVARLATNMLAQENLGTDRHTDMLLLQFTVKPSTHTTARLQNAEQEDMYIRLDRILQNLMYQVKTKTGERKVLFFMIGTSMDNHTPLELGKHKIPSGYFNAERSQALLNTYLMALYGNEKWISGYYDKHFYLNYELIRKKKINKQEMVDRISRFLEEFEGVQAAYTADEIKRFSELEPAYNQMVMNSYQVSLGGDVVIKLLPGWIEVDNGGKILGSADRSMRTFSLYMLGENVKKKKIKHNPKSVDFAPTISRMLNIAKPNATVGTSLFLTSE